MLSTVHAETELDREQIFFEKIAPLLLPRHRQRTNTLLTHFINTPLGIMMAVANPQHLYLLCFLDGKNLKRHIQQIQKNTQAGLAVGKNEPLQSIETELQDYFQSQLSAFQTPLYFVGTEFQKSAWNTLRKIPYGQTRSYLQEAQAIGKPKAFRAVALANGANPFTIVVPCHRIINHNGALGGYGAGLERKRWLLAHEKKGFQ